MIRPPPVPECTWPLSKPGFRKTTSRHSLSQKDEKQLKHSVGAPCDQTKHFSKNWSSKGNHSLAVSASVKLASKWQAVSGRDGTAQASGWSRRWASCNGGGRGSARRADRWKDRPKAEQMHPVQLSAKALRAARGHLPSPLLFLLPAPPPPSILKQTLVCSTKDSQHWGHTTRQVILLFKHLFIYFLFIWLCWVSVEARDLLDVGSSSLTRDWTWAPWIGSRVLTTGPPGKFHVRQFLRVSKFLCCSNHCCDEHFSVRIFMLEEIV